LRRVQKSVFLQFEPIGDYVLRSLRRNGFTKALDKVISLHPSFAHIRVDRAALLDGDVVDAVAREKRGVQNDGCVKEDLVDPPTVSHELAAFDVRNGC